MNCFYNVRIKIEAPTKEDCDSSAKTLVDKSNQMAAQLNGIQSGVGKTTEYKLIPEIEAQIAKKTINPDLMFVIGAGLGLLTQIWF